MNYSDCTIEQLSKHLETVTRQTISYQVRKYSKLCNFEMVAKIKDAKSLLRRRKFLGKHGGIRICGVGVYEKGKYTSSTKGYRVWTSLIERCYKHDTLETRPSYVGCTVSEDFLYFQNFMLWAEAQRGFGCDDFQIDKDLLVRGNKQYSKDTCVFIPREINLALTKSDAARGDLPIGVYRTKVDGRHKAQCRGKNLGVFSSPELAFHAYKLAKEEYLKSLAEKHVRQIDGRAYTALVNYEVLITD